MKGTITLLLVSLLLIAIAFFSKDLREKKSFYPEELAKYELFFELGMNLSCNQHYEEAMRIFELILRETHSRELIIKSAQQVEELNTRQSLRQKRITH